MKKRNYEGTLVKVHVEGSEVTIRSVVFGEKPQKFFSKEISKRILISETLLCYKEGIDFVLHTTKLTRFILRISKSKFGKTRRQTLTNENVTKI